MAGSGPEQIDWVSLILNLAGEAGTDYERTNPFGGLLLESCPMSRIISRNLCARAFAWRTVWTCLSRGDLTVSAQAASLFFDPGLLLGNQALHELGPFLL